MTSFVGLRSAVQDHIPKHALLQDIQPPQSFNHRNAIALLTHQILPYRPSSIDVPDIADMESPAELQYFQDHMSDDRGRGFTIYVYICLVLTTAVLAMRLIARHMAKIKYQKDDYCAMLALVSSLPTSLALELD